MPGKRPDNRRGNINATVVMNTSVMEKLSEDMGQEEGTKMAGDSQRNLQHVCEGSVTTDFQLNDYRGYYSRNDACIKLHGTHRIKLHKTRSISFSLVKIQQALGRCEKKQRSRHGFT